VQQLVNAIGGWEQVEVDDGQYETIYRPGDSVLGVLKDLKKLWRKDDTDDERTVARCMAKAGLMKELIALVKECTPRGDWGRKVSLMAREFTGAVQNSHSVDLVAALTWPIDVAAELKEMEDETEIPSDYASLLRYQVEYKVSSSK
jgi:replication fork protection complex subunit Tof1/Swi1